MLDLKQLVRSFSLSSFSSSFPIADLLPHPSQQPHTPKFGFHTSGKSSHDGSPKHELGAYFGGGKETEEQREQREWEKEKKRRRKVKEKKKAQEVFITMHVSRPVLRVEKFRSGS